MAKCENCIHEIVCECLIETGLPFNDDKFPADKCCRSFKDKSFIVELPCKVGDKLYIVGTECLADKDSRKCEEWTAENPGLSCEDCPLDKRLIVFERTVTKHMLGVILFEGNENFIFGENVFLSREEAEKKLKECEQ